MDENNLPKTPPPAPPDLPTDETDFDQDDTAIGENVFDITPDFNIAPAPLKPDPPAVSAPPSAPVGTIADNRSRELADFVEEAKRRGVKPIRTFESDVAELLSQAPVSKATIAIAENKKQAQNTDEIIASKTPKHTGKNILFIILSVILVVGGLYGAYYLYLRSPLAPATPPTTTTSVLGQSVIEAESAVAMNVDGLNAATIASRIKNEIAKAQPAGSLKEIIPVRWAGGAEKRVTAPDMLSIMGVEPPDILTRSFGPSWMLGSYGENSGSNSLFIVVTDNFFQNAFAGMLQWEKTVPGDLSAYLPTATVAPMASSSSSNIHGGAFVDRIIHNHDVREYVSNGQILFSYSFIDENRLVVTGSETALSEIFNRIDKQAYMR